MYQTRNQTSIKDFWGIDIQPERLNTLLKYTPAGSKILDLGSGRGVYTKTLNNQGFPTTGVDSYHYTEWDTQPNEWFIKASASSLPFVDKTFHTTICFEVLEHCSEPEKVLQEISRCTIDKLVLSVPNCDLNNTLRKYDLSLAHWTDSTHINFFTKKSIQNLLESLNFKLVEISDCYKINPNNYFWNTIKLPKLFRKIGKKVCEKLKLTEIYYSSILIVAEIPK